MPPENIAVAVCNGVAEAVRVIAELDRHGIEPECMSMVAIDEYSAFDPVGYCMTDGHLRRAAAGGCAPVLDKMTGYTVLVAPGQPVILLAGPIGACVSRTLQNKALFGALGPIASLLYALGASRVAACGYETAARQGRALIVVHGRARNVARARELLRGSGK